MSALFLLRDVLRAAERKETIGKGFLLVYSDRHGIYCSPKRPITNRNTTLQVDGLPSLNYSTKKDGCTNIRARKLFMYSVSNDSWFVRLCQI